MAVLTILLPFFLLPLYAAEPVRMQQFQKIECESTQEFVSAVSYLRKQKKISLPENEILKAALRIAQNCDGASRRFQKMLDMLTKAGVDADHALHFSMDYSREDNESVDAFLSLFQGLVLEKKFNLAFYEAFETSKFFALSTRKGDRAELKKEFLGFLGFCFEDAQGMLLSLEQCRGLSLKYLELHDFYPKGAFQDFKALFSFLRQEKETGLPILSALSITQEVLKSGPGARKNFIDSYKYALHNLNMKPKEALALGLKLASFTRSVPIEEPVLKK